MVCRMAAQPQSTLIDCRLVVGLLFGPVISNSTHVSRATMLRETKRGNRGLVLAGDYGQFSHRCQLAARPRGCLCERRQSLAYQ